MTTLTIVQDFCGNNGCDTGETILGVVIVIAVAMFAIAMMRF